MNDETIYGTTIDSTGQISSTGDILLISGVELARQEIKKELICRVGDYFADDEYGSDLLNTLGEAGNNVLLDSLNLLITDFSNKNPYIESLEDVKFIFPSTDTLHMKITFQLVDGTLIDIEEELEVWS